MKNTAVDSKRQSLRKYGVSVLLLIAIAWYLSVNSERLQYIFLNSSQYSVKLETEIDGVSVDAAGGGELGRLYRDAKSVCYVGDSITAGSENGGYPWYGPLAAAFPRARVESLAVGGGTSLSLLQLSKESLPVCDLYIIALGTNDVRYRDAAKGALTADDYIWNLKRLVSRAKEVNPDSRFVFIAPWSSISEDPVPPVTREEKEKLLNEYSEALQAWCGNNGYIYINPNQFLALLVKHPFLRKHYMEDHIHPTHPYGCYLYSAAVWEAAE